MLPILLYRRLSREITVSSSSSYIKPREWDVCNCIDIDGDHSSHPLRSFDTTSNEITGQSYPYYYSSSLSSSISTREERRGKGQVVIELREWWWASSGTGKKICHIFHFRSSEDRWRSPKLEHVLLFFASSLRECVHWCREYFQWQDCRDKCHNSQLTNRVTE